MKKVLLLSYLYLLIGNLYAQQKIVVFQTDFGVKDGAVSAMKGVSMSVDSSLNLFDLTHEIPAYNIWEAAYRLEQTLSYWPAGTVFVSVVDPGVGTDRKSVVLQTKSGHYIVTPDNGTLTLIAESKGIAAVRQINEQINRRPGSEESYTFHGRDVYAYTAARLAAGKIRFDEVGPALPNEVVRIPYQQAEINNQVITGNIPILDVQYGNVWTNIPKSLFTQAGIGINDRIRVKIFHGKQPVYDGILPYVTSFGAVRKGKPLAYFNSLMQLSFALNMGNFAATHKVSSGNDWWVEVRKM